MEKARNLKGRIENAKNVRVLNAESAAGSE